jgi:hypothetical protein
VPETETKTVFKPIKKVENIIVGRVKSDWKTTRTDAKGITLLTDEGDVLVPIALLDALVSKDITNTEVVKSYGTKVKSALNNLTHVKKSLGIVKINDGSTFHFVR